MKIKLHSTVKITSAGIFMNKSCVRNLRIHFLKCHVKLALAGNLFVTFFSFFNFFVYVCCFKLLITKEHVLYLQLTGYHGK